MENHEYSVGLDIGTTKIVAIVGRKNTHGKIEVLGIGKAKSLGVSRGIITNIIQTIDSIKKAVEQAEKNAGIPIKKVAVGIAGNHIHSKQISDYIMRENSDDTITESDIELLKEQVKKIPMLPGEEIIHTITQDFKIDNEGGIYQPLGMYGKRLEANFHVVVGKTDSIRNIYRCVREAGLEVEALTLEPLASADAVLTEDEKESGVALIDIGGGTTDIAIFKDNILRHTCVIPYGGNIITEDIKEGGLLLEREAEALKIKFGSAVPSMVEENIKITIPAPFDRPDKEISIKSLAQIINARMEEIIDLINIELKSYGAREQKKKLISGIVLTGGGSNLRHLRQLVSQMTGFDCRIGRSNEYIINDEKHILGTPEYATSVGLLMESLSIYRPKQEETPKLPTTTPPILTDEAEIEITENSPQIENVDNSVDKKTQKENHKPKKKSIFEKYLEKMKKWWDEEE